MFSVAIASLNEVPGFPFVDCFVDIVGTCIFATAIFMVFLCKVDILQPTYYKIKRKRKHKM